MSLKTILQILYKIVSIAPYDLYTITPGRTTKGVQNNASV